MGASPNSILQGGNSFVAPITIGSNDNYDLNLETNGITRMTIASTGAINTTGTLTAADVLTISSGGAAITGDTIITGTTSVTGDLGVSSTTTIDGVLYPSGGIEAEGTTGGGSGILNTGITDNTDTINIATGTTAQTINLGTGAGATTINIGSSDDTINIYDDTYYNHVTELQVADKLITINRGGAAASGANAGLEIEENSSATGYAKTSGDRARWLLKAPASEGIVSIIPGPSDFSINQGVSTNDEPVFAGIQIENNANIKDTLSVFNETQTGPGVRIYNEEINLEQCGLLTFNYGRLSTINPPAKLSDRRIDKDKGASQIRLESEIVQSITRGTIHFDCAEGLNPTELPMSMQSQMSLNSSNLRLSNMYTGAPAMSAIVSGAIPLIEGFETEIICPRILCGSVSSDGSPRPGGNSGGWSVSRHPTSGAAGDYIIFSKKNLAQYQSSSLR